MNWKEFEHNVKRGAKNQELEQDHLQLWEALEPKVDKLNRKKKNRGAIFFLLFIGLGMLGLSAIYFYPGRSFSKVDNKEVVKDRGGFQTDATRTRYESDQQLMANEETEDKEFNSVINEKGFRNINAISQNQNPTELSTDEKLNFGQSDLAHWENEHTITNIDVVRFNSEQQIIWEEFRNHVDAHMAKEVEKRSGRSDEGIGHAIITEQNYELNALAANGFSLLTDPDLEKPIDYRMADPFYELEPKNVKLKKDRVFFSKLSLIGHGYAGLKKLTPKTRDFNTLAKIREQTETTLETVQLGLVLELAKVGQFSLSSGINWTQISERLNYTLSENEVVLFEGTKYLVSNLAGSLIEIEGELEEVYLQNTHFIKFNQYRFVDVPLLIGFTSRIGKWNMNLEAGPYFNISLNSKGSILDVDLDFLRLDSEDVLKDRIGVSLGLNANFERALGEHFSVQFGPSFRWMPSSLSYESNPIDQRYILLGLNAGLSYRF